MCCRYANEKCLFLSDSASRHSRRTWSTVSLCPHLPQVGGSLPQACTRREEELFNKTTSRIYTRVAPQAVVRIEISKYNGESRLGGQDPCAHQPGGRWGSLRDLAALAVASAGGGLGGWGSLGCAHLRGRWLHLLGWRSSASCNHRGGRWRDCRLTDCGSDSRRRPL
nr:uncharacterized protein LOC129381097 [Dermacentor andersoni]